MKRTEIIILGDSTSMTIGMERMMYPYVLADTKAWPESTTFVNCSQPGFTTADMCRFFFKHAKSDGTTKGVIIHPGMCDSISSEIQKRKYNYRRQLSLFFKELLNIKKTRSNLRNRLHHFSWDNFFDQGIEVTTKTEDYAYNLTRIVRYCVRSSIPVILIRPMGHLNFPPGLGKGNFVFYRYVGNPDKLTDKLTIQDDRFVNALRQHEQGNFREAIERYKEILLHSGSLSNNYEYILVVLNNYGACTADAGNLEEAEYIFKLLLKEKSVRNEIILYNLSQVFKLKGDEENHLKLLNESYESDFFMYRVRSPYLTVIDAISDKYSKSVQLIDTTSFIQDSLYVDHCHPLPAGQKILAKEILKGFVYFGIQGSQKGEIRNILYNPEFSLGNSTEFYSYYRTYAPYSESDIKQFVRQVKALGTKSNTAYEDILGDFFPDTIPKEFKMAVEYHLIHPCFPTLNDLLHFGPKYPSDIGRFPEFFLIRHIIPYLRIHEQHVALKDRFSIELGILRHSKQLLMALPGRICQLVSKDDPPIEPEFELLRLDRILSKVKDNLSAHLRKGNQVYERIKTTIYWFFRETLRYGPHSRVSMRYDRPILEYFAEALAVAGVLDLSLGFPCRERTEELIGLLEETIIIHEHFCSQIFGKGDNSTLLKDYDGRLNEILKRVELVDLQGR